MHETHFHNDEWNCSCPYFLEHCCCKHLISFKINVLKEKVPQPHCIGRLLVRPKRGRPKTVPHFLEPVIYEIDDSEESDSDEMSTSGPACI